MSIYDYNNHRKFLETDKYISLCDRYQKYILIATNCEGQTEDEKEYQHAKIIHQLFDRHNKEMTQLRYIPMVGVYQESGEERSCVEYLIPYTEEISEKGMSFSGMQDYALELMKEYNQAYIFAIEVGDDRQLRGELLGTNGTEDAVIIYAENNEFGKYLEILSQVNGVEREWTKSGVLTSPDTMFGKHGANLRGEITNR